MYPKVPKTQPLWWKGAASLGERVKRAEEGLERTELQKSHVCTGTLVGGQEAGDGVRAVTEKQGSESSGQHSGRASQPSCSWGPACTLWTRSRQH